MANLALGLVGFVALDAFESSVAAGLETQSRSFLGADVVVSSSLPLTHDERRALDDAAGLGARVAVSTELFSMAAGAGRARLVEIRAVDGLFPLYGTVDLGDVGAARGPEWEELDRIPGAWVDPPLLAQLGVAVGDPIRIGTSEFRILHTIARDGGRARADGSIAPRVYLSVDRLAATGLIANGSRIRYQRFYRLAPGAPLDEVVTRLNEVSTGDGIAVRTHADAIRQLARGFGAVSDYLGLVSLIAVFLAGVGSANLFREFLSRRLRDLAILMSLGATRSRAQGIFVVQLWVLASAAAALASGLAAALLPWIGRAADAVTPTPVTLAIGMRSLALAIGLALLGSTAACLPLLVRIRSLRPAQLFAEQARPRLDGGRDLLLLIPAMALFWAAAVWRVGDWRAGSAFAGMFTAALVGFAVLGHAGLRSLHAVPTGRALGVRLAFRHLSRARASALGGFVSLALCAFLVSLPPQLQATLASGLDPPRDERLPSLFLFDVQPEQLAGLKEHVAGRGARFTKISPMVRARLDAIDGEPVGSLDTATANGEARGLRARRYNLTYGPDLSDSERRVAGRPFRGMAHPSGPAEISLESDFATRLGVGLGNQLTFDVQGVPVEGRVTSLREVRWSSFEPNFFVVFQPGVLEQAPQIHLASIARMPDAQREALQGSIVEAFPNISVIDVTAAVRRLLILFEQLQWALQSTASASLAVGMLLIYVVARDSARARRGETNLLKVLGADFRVIRSAVDIEFGVLGLLATVAGVSFSVVASYWLAWVLLDSAWTIAWTPLALAAVAFPVLCVWTARMGTRNVLRERPLALLQAAES